ncbi:hypothetical protein N781_12865 [Pontibacillus halophilus JSM 076056 = DSM 19796]|uniref:Uncharacterized protein n=1 Tax=Pontibacillus halophilus JSM 076056 = DSM 19796 TaxID=1385510 RepID=A0A0A5IBS4_9BACI|nr:YugN family protein [Pontibacillus halophilus]KGX93292.1 hypothetical protein N781_12865 [Pontibacillus halophilus JSM 076056 = DSM 19796]
MRIDGKGIEGTVVAIDKLNHILDDCGFVRGGQWDYERVTYDYKFSSPTKGITYYLRVQGFAVEGTVDSRHALMQLLTPLLGKHYYPHGVEYGDGEDFPETLVERSNKLLEKVREQINEFQENKQETLREENKRLRAELEYLKKNQQSSSQDGTRSQQRASEEDDAVSKQAEEVEES